MAKLTKKQKEAASKIEKNKLYSLKDAAALIKVVASAKFDESVDIAFLGSTPNRTAISTDSSNFAEATTFINAAASFKEYS